MQTYPSIRLTFLNLTENQQRKIINQLDLYQSPWRSLFPTRLFSSPHTFTPSASGLVSLNAQHCGSAVCYKPRTKKTVNNAAGSFQLTLSARTLRSILSVIIWDSGVPAGAAVGHNPSVGAVEPSYLHRCSELSGCCCCWWWLRWWRCCCWLLLDGRHLRRLLWLRFHCHRLQWWLWWRLW